MDLLAASTHSSYSYTHARLITVRTLFIPRDTFPNTHSFDPHRIGLVGDIHVFYEASVKIAGRYGE